MIMAYNHLEIERKFIGEFEEDYNRRIKEIGLSKKMQYEFLDLEELNVLPQESQLLIREYGYDCINLYHLFSKPRVFCDWDDGGLDGVDRFIRRFYALSIEIINHPGIKNEEMDKLLKKLKFQVHEAIEQKKQTTIVSSYMKLVSELSKLEKKNQVDQDSFSEILILFSPFAPFLSMDLWNKLIKDRTIFQEKWPHKEQLEEEEMICIPIQINGRTKTKIWVNHSATKDQIQQMARKKLSDRLANAEVQVIYVPGKIMNYIPLINSDKE